MDVGTLILLVLIAVAGGVLVIARGAPADDGDAAVVVTSLLGPWLDPAASRAPVVRESEEVIRWRFDQVVPDGPPATVPTALNVRRAWMSHGPAARP